MLYPNGKKLIAGLAATALILGNLQAAMGYRFEAKIDVSENGTSSLNATQAAESSSRGNWDCNNDVMVKGKHSATLVPAADIRRRGDLSDGVVVGKKEIQFSLQRTENGDPGRGGLGIRAVCIEEKTYSLHCKDGEVVLRKSTRKVRKSNYKVPEGTEDKHFNFFQRWHSTHQKKDKEKGKESLFKFDESFLKLHSETHLKDDSYRVTFSAVKMGQKGQCMKLEEDINAALGKVQNQIDDFNASTSISSASMKGGAFQVLKPLNHLQVEHANMGCAEHPTEQHKLALAKLEAGFVAAHKEGDQAAAQQRWGQAVQELQHETEEGMSFSRLVKICKMFFGTDKLGPTDPDVGDVLTEDDKVDHDIDDEKSEKISVELEGKLQEALEGHDMDDGTRSSLAQRKDDAEMMSDYGVDPVVAGVIAGVVFIAVVYSVGAAISIAITIMWWLFLAALLFSLGVLTLRVLGEMFACRGWYTHGRCL